MPNTATAALPSDPVTAVADTLPRTVGFVVTPASTLDLTRRIGLALAILSTESDPGVRRARAVQALLTACTDDAVHLS